MLKKLFKYEFQAMGRILIPIYLITIAFSVLSAGFTIFMGRDIPSEYDYLLNPLAIAYCLIFSIFVMLIMAIFIINLIITLQRFAKNLMGSEGYLMHTIPVTPAQHILVKLVTAITYQILAMLVAVFAIAIFVIAIGVGSGYPIFTAALQEINNLQITNYPGLLFPIGNTILDVLISLVYTYMSFYAAMSMGYSVNSHKIASSIGFYVLIYIIHSIVSHSIVSILTNGLPYSEYVDSNIFINNILSVAFIIAFFYIAYYFIKNRLNLE